jgi:hypothetical protein
LSGRARNASDGRLAFDVGVGLVVTIVAVIWRPSGWHIVASAALCFLAFGAWGITDRELRERQSASAASFGAYRSLHIGRAVAAGVGALAAGGLLISLLGIALGTWIS